MNRYDILKMERERTLEKLQTDAANRAKWLVRLMDIDDELDELMLKEEKQNFSKLNHRIN